MRSLWTRALTASAALVALGGACTLAQELPSSPLSLGGGRVVVGADASLSASPQDDNLAWFNYTDYEHNAMRLFRVGATANVRLTPRIFLLGDLRTENGDGVRAYALYARIRPWANRAFDIQVGRIPPAFGAFSRRAYGNANPLIGYPLAYQYLTSLRPDAIPANADELLHMRARGWRPSFTIGSQTISTGVPLVTAFDWDTGVQLHGETGSLSAALAVTSGTLSDPHVRDNNSGKQVSGRAQWHPNAGFTFGASMARGEFLSESVQRERPEPGGGLQRATGLDAEYSLDHWLVRGEAVWSRWTIPTIAAPLAAGSAFAEGSYKIRPGLFAAARVDTLRFNAISTPTRTSTWDAPVTRIEAGIGVYAQRNLLVRGTVQQNWRDGGQFRKRRLFGLQLEYWL